MLEPLQQQKFSRKNVSLPTKQPSRTAICMLSCTEKLEDSNMLYCKANKPVKLKIYETSNSQKAFFLIKLKTQKDW